MKKITLKEIALTGVMAAAVYVASALLQIPIPTPIDSTRIHMGNVLCLLSGLLLGPFYGGLAAGIGSMFFDLTNPAYIASAPFTFAFKFIMAWLCGKIATPRKENAQSAKQRAGQERPQASCRSVTGSYLSPHGRSLIGGFCGAFAYVLLYLSKSFLEHCFLLGLPLAAVLPVIAQKAVVSGINAVIAVLVATPLGRLLRPALQKIWR